MKCPFVIKICTKCKRILVANEMNFHKAKNGKYSLGAVCKICVQKEYKEKNFEGNPFNNIDSNKVWNHCSFCIKVCPDCKRILVANKINFYKKKDGKWGLSKICKKCEKKYKEEHKEEIKECKKQWYEKHREERSNYKKQWYEDNKKEVSEYNKQYYKENPHISFNNTQKRRLREENQGEGITKEQWLEMMEFFDWKCAYSGEYIGRKENRSIDHIIPLSLGGENEIWNLVPMLRNLNSSKNNKNMIEWYMEQDFFDIDRLLKIYEWIEYAYKKWE